MFVKYTATIIFYEYTGYLKLGTDLGNVYSPIFPALGNICVLPPKYLA